ncbi:unnamed protein product [Notodromas monacha]|uniref:RING finger protein 141 n=1 Tax=Notodromas monacha TaxID=399045 RepID=A0A7R9BJ34_9CRUS|nr:unnamed protein product [Notodromas monacha]CAG0915567.1 unnamed protein product [Notodromas monacha]
MGQAKSNLVSNDLDLVMVKLVNSASNWKQIAGLTYAEFLEQIADLNRLSNSFQDSKGKRLLFAVKPGTDDSFLWKATVRIACCKICGGEKGKLESYRLLNIKQLQKVHQNLQLQAEEMLKSYKSNRPHPDTASSSSSCETSDSSDYDETGAAAKRKTFKTLRPKLTASLILEEVGAELGTDLEECCICFERQPEVILPCAHSYCLLCIEQWNVNSQTCPVCRKDLEMNDFNVENAVDAFRDHLVWRSNYSVDDIEEKYIPVEVMKLYSVGGYVGPDRENRPVLFLPFSYADLRGLRRSTKAEDWILHAIKLLEEGKRRCRISTDIHGTDIDRITIVFDIANTSVGLFLWLPFFEVMYFLLRMFDDNYPEFAHKIIVLNCPRMFSVALMMIGQSLRKSTAERIQCYGRDEAEWTEAIFAEIDPEKWPKHWGGKFSEGIDERCIQSLGKGFMVPEEFYSHPTDDPPSELMEYLSRRTLPAIRKRVDSVTGAENREHIENIAGNFLAERLTNDAGYMLREFIEHRIGPLISETINTSRGPLRRDSLFTPLGMLLRETLTSVNQRTTRQRIELASERYGRLMNEHIASIRHEIPPTFSVLPPRYSHEETFVIPNEAKLVYPVLIDSAGWTIRWLYLLKGSYIDFVMKFSTDVEKIVKEVRRVAVFDTFEGGEKRWAIVKPRSRLLGSTEPGDDNVFCAVPGYYVLEFSNALSRRETKVLYLSVDLDPPDTQPQRPHRDLDATAVPDSTYKNTVTPEPPQPKESPLALKAKAISSNINLSQPSKSENLPQQEKIIENERTEMNESVADNVAASETRSEDTGSSATQNQPVAQGDDSQQKTE